MARWWLSAVIIVLGAHSGLARVVPSKDAKDEKFGTAWERVELKDWLTREEALITPELTNLAVQACLRSQQELMDRKASRLLSGLGRSLAGELAGSRGVYETGLEALGQLMDRVETIEATDVKDYQKQCHSSVKEALGAKADALIPLYEGRLHPKIPAELADRGVAIAPLTWDGLRDQICNLEGYYGTSPVSLLWKFFSLSRIMANVLPAEGEDTGFVKVVDRLPDLRSRIVKLNQYSAIAGKVNGAAIGMEKDSAGPRRTGAGIGSDATSLLAFFTTSWRENVQQAVFSRPYPTEPFALLRAEELLKALRVSRGCGRCGGGTSSTELGMTAVWYSVLPRFTPGAREDAALAYYRKTASLAWLALNSEANVRPSEKIAGFARESSDVEAAVTQWVYGSPSSYVEISRSIDAAVKAFQVLDPAGESLSSCAPRLKEFAVAASKVESAKVGKVSDESRLGFLEVGLSPVIADIGLEVDDPTDGVFRLQLASGAGRSTRAQIEGKGYSLWTPSAFALHLPRAISTAEWRAGLVETMEH